MADDGFIGTGAKDVVDLAAQGSKHKSPSDFNSTAREQLTFYPKSRHASGFMVVPMVAATESWTLAAGRSGSATSRRWQASIEPLRDEKLVLSDLVLGAEGQQVSSLIGAQSVVLAPLPVVSRGESVNIYYQLRSDSSRANALTTIRVMRVLGGTEQLEEVLTMGFRSDLVAGFNQIERGLDVSHLGGARYLVDVTVSDSVGRVHATQRGTLDLRN